MTQPLLSETVKWCRWWCPRLYRLSRYSLVPCLVSFLVACKSTAPEPSCTPAKSPWIFATFPPVDKGAGDLGGVALYDGDKLIHWCHAMGGTKGHVTPVGSFRINQRDQNHKSSLYGDCVNKSTKSRRPVENGRCLPGETFEGSDMAYYLGFAYATGFHRGDLKLKSHGCIHLAEKDAKILWCHVKNNTEVHICAGGRCFERQREELKKRSQK